MRFIKRESIYRSSSGKCSFNPIRMEAWSYRWWQFVAFIDGKVYFNGYHYSMPTGCHQRAVRKLMADHGIKYTYVSYACGLQNIDGQVALFESEIEKIQAAIAAPRSHKRKNAERRVSIAALREDIKLAKRLARLKRRPSTVRLKNFPPVAPKPTPEQLKQRAERRKQRAANAAAESAYQNERTAITCKTTPMPSLAVANNRLFLVRGGAL